MNSKKRRMKPRVKIESNRLGGSMNWSRYMYVVFACCLQMLFLSSAGAQQSQKPVRVGILMPLTGPFAGQAKEEVDGWNLAIREVGGSVAGRAIETVVLDTAADPNKAITLARQLVTAEKVDLLFGPLASHVSNAVKPYLRETGLPTLFPACDVEPVPGTVVKNILQSGRSCFVVPIMFGDFAYKQLGYKHVTIVAGDFSFGWQTAGGFLASFEKAGGVVDKLIWTPITLNDYSPVMAEIPPTTDAVFVVLVGAQALRFVSAYKGFGLAGKLPLIATGHLTNYSVLPQMPEDAVLGVVTADSYTEGLPTPENAKFVKAFKAVAGRYPSWFGETAYSSAMLFAAGLKKTGGDASKDALVAAMKSSVLDTPHGRMSIDASTNSAIINVYISKVQRVNGELINVPFHTYDKVPPWGLLSTTEWQDVARKYSASRPVARQAR
jgi:branched-chain amino acid transport system substrate-binding protein